MQEILRRRNKLACNQLEKAPEERRGTLSAGKHRARKGDHEDAVSVLSLKQSHISPICRCSD